MHRKGHLSTNPPVVMSTCASEVFLPCRLQLVELGNLYLRSQTTQYGLSHWISGWNMWQHRQHQRLKHHQSPWCFQHFANGSFTGIRPAKRQRRSVEDWRGAVHGPGLDFWIRKWMRWMAEIRPKRGSAVFWSWGIASNWTWLYSIQNCSPMSMTTFGAAQWSVCTDFCQEFLEQFSVLNIPDWQQWSLVWWQESVISLLCFRIFLIEI